MLQSGITKKEMFAWASLDFANSGYTTVVLTTIFNVYFVTVIAGDVAEATFLWTLTLSISYVFIMIISPLIGSYVDARATHRKILLLATICCSISTIILGFCGVDDMKLAIFFLVLSNCSYAIHQNTTAALLSKIADIRHLGKISGYGWAWGFVGGILSLVLSLWWLSQSFSVLPSGLSEGVDQGIMGALTLTGFLFLLIGCFSLYSLRNITIYPTNLDWKNSWSNHFFNISRLTLERDILILYFCIFLYHCGITAVITVASIYASKVMGFTIKEIVGLVLIVNISACIGSFIFGSLQDKVGHKSSLVGIVLFWVIAILFLFFSNKPLMFYISANLIGLGLGAAQSAGRASIAYLAPKRQQAEYFGVWGFFVNASSVVGPLSYGVLTLIFLDNHKLAAVGLLPFFILSLILLHRVRFVRPR